jgi:hypothetical protein
VVNVNVTDPQTDAVKGFYTYLVSGSDHLGSFEIRRRYNDFFYLRESLVRKWPGLYIPPIPEKKIAVPSLPCRETRTSRIFKPARSSLTFS